uniref:Rho-GAP domain-containing protein n=1 Tax=Panagrolaimus sp. ES5 TaxID=591445 RepID=A0AC34GXZ1_9BILA
MLSTAKELSTFSANDCSRSSSTSVMSKSLQTKLVEKNEEKHHLHHLQHHLQSSNNTFPLKSENTFKDGSASPDLSTKVSIDELSNLSEVDSLIKELDEASSTHCNRPQGGTPKFLKMDDQYTTNNYVSIVRDIAEKQTKKRSKDDALIRTSSWAANLATNPPPLPVTSVPSTPIMSKYRIMNSSMKISPDYIERNDTPTSTKSADNTDGYFLHYEDSLHPFVTGVHKKFSHFASKIVNGQRLKPMSLTMNHPTSDNNSEASLTRSDIGERQFARLGGALVMRNAAFDANSTFPFIQRNYDVTFMNRSNEKPITVTRIDELLEYDSDYLYDIQSADKLQLIHELALQEISTYVERSVSLRIKQWGMKLDVIRNIRNKFSRPQPPEPIIKNKLFGMPLFMVQAQNGNGCPFPKFIMDIMEYLKESAINMDGIFRRCGSQKRIQEMREICDSLSCHDSLPEELKSLNQINDLSDLLKQYLRALPQRLVPESISEVVTCAISTNSSDKHLDIMKLMTLIMPDDHRDGLLVFLEFLLSISKNSTHNLMTVDNLSICTMPTIFALNDISQSSTSARRRKTVAIMNDKDAIQYKALKEALSVLISYRSELETIPSHILKAANMKPFHKKKKKELKDAMQPIEEIGAAASLRCFVATLFKEYDEYWKTWHIDFINENGIIFATREEYDEYWKTWHIDFINENGIIFATREVDDSCSLKSCRVQLTVPASPKNVVSALINHREKWDLITTSTKPTFIDISNKEDIAHITFNNFNTSTIKKATVARVWEDDEPGSGRAFVAEKSCKKDPFCVNVEIYHSAFIICPFNGKAVINYICRIDLK